MKKPIPSRPTRKDEFEQLKRSNRRWKTLALVSCAALALLVVMGGIFAEQRRMQTERELRDVMAAQARAVQAKTAKLR